MPSPHGDPEPFLKLIEGKQNLCGRFTDIERIGASGGGGSFSLMFRATDTQTGQAVALKFFDPREADPYRVECFKREIDVLGTLDGQPDILRRITGPLEITEVLHHHTGLSFPIVFRFYGLELAASDFGTILESYPMEPIDKLAHFRVMCRAIQRVHKLRIVHRDVKPSNFLLMHDGSTCLSDFGAARDLGSPAIMPRYSAPPGDFTYASLEMAAALHDARPEIAYAGDMYALGAILFEMFSGTPLNLHVFSMPMLIHFNGVMSTLSPVERVREFHKNISSTVNSFPLPDIRDFGSGAPRSIAPILNRMYRQLCALDYRQRVLDCSSTFLQMNQCLVVLKNEAAFARWDRRRKAFRRAAEEKRKFANKIANGANV